MRLKILSAAIFAALALVFCGAARAQESKSIIHYGMRLETHTDRDSPDDYTLNMVSITRHLENRVAGSVFAIYKYNMDSGATGGFAMGVNLVSVCSENQFMTMGYTHTINDKDSTRTQRTDRDRLRLGLYRTLRRTKRGNIVQAFAAYNTQTDWSESRTLDFGFSYKQPTTPHWTALAAVRYTQGLGQLDAHLYDQYEAGLTYKLAPNAEAMLGYLFVDKAYTTPAGAPDNDNVFRLGVTYRYE